jgi:hypothetical protein
MGITINPHRITVEKCVGKRPLLRQRHGWQDVKIILEM